MFYNLDDLPYWDVPSNRATVTKKREREMAMARHPGVGIPTKVLLKKTQ